MTISQILLALASLLAIGALFYALSEWEKFTKEIGGCE